MFELNPVEGVDHAGVATANEEVLFGVGHVVEIDLLSADVAERGIESQIGFGEFVRDDRVVADWA